MLMSMRCIPCFIKQAFMEIECSSMDDADREKAIRDVLQVLSEHNYNVKPVDIASEIHKIVKSHGGGNDPYKELKMNSTDNVLKKIDGIKDRVRSSPDPLRQAVIVSIAGNVIDYGAKNFFDLDTILDKAEIKGLRIDDYDAFKENISSTEMCVYLLDNSGEIVMDSILMTEMIIQNPDLRIQAVVKKSPILNDVTYEDAVYAGIDGIPGVDINQLPNDGWVESQLIESLDKNVMVISKGQGNFESLSDVNNVFFLFVVKCENVADFMGVEVEDMILKHNTSLSQ